MATTSSGLTVMFGSLPPVRRRTSVLDGGDARRAADEDDLVDVVGRQLGVGQRLLDRAAAALDQVGRQLLELRARESSCSGACGPDASAVMNGRLTCVCVVVESSTLARSAAS